MKIEEIKKFENKTLEEKIIIFQEQLFNLRINKNGIQKNTSLKKNIKKTIARIKTVLQQRKGKEIS